MIDVQHSLWGEPAIPGQLTLKLDAAGGRPASPTRQPMPAAAGWADQAATGGLIVSLRNPTAGRRGVARWYALGVQDRLDGGADVICAWGRLGHRCTHPHQRAHPYPSWTAARAALAAQVARRAARGYRPTA
jgi:predicted DNA-binding WGR domain protein